MLKSQLNIACRCRPTAEVLSSITRTRYTLGDAAETDNTTYAHILWLQMDAREKLSINLMFDWDKERLRRGTSVRLSSRSESPRTAAPACRPDAAAAQFACTRTQLQPADLASIVNKTLVAARPTRRIRLTAAMQYYVILPDSAGAILKSPI